MTLAPALLNLFAMSRIPLQPAMPTPRHSMSTVPSATPVPDSYTHYLQMQAHSYLSKLDAQLCTDVSAITFRNDGTNLWYTTVLCACLPMQPYTVAAFGVHITAHGVTKLPDLLWSIAALHHLPPTSQPADTAVFSCTRSLCGVLEYAAALLSVPDVLEGAPDDLMANLMTTLSGMKGIVHGRAMHIGEKLLNHLKEQAPQLALSVQHKEQDKQVSELLAIANSTLVSSQHCPAARCCCYCQSHCGACCTEDCMLLWNMHGSSLHL